MSDSKDNGLRVGPYELLTRLASGGMGEVFIARRTGDGDFEKKVALKLLLPHLVPDAEFIQLFFDEARLAARMNHPNIVHIFDVGQSDGRPYLAMALVEGISVGQLVKLLRANQQQLSLPLVRLIATGLLEALSYAHALKGTRGEELNVIHRDVTPSNVLLSTAGAVMLNDFGIAKAAINSHQTRPGTLRGKFAYLAPEQAHRGKLTSRADLFSAGVTLYELLTLTSPFFRGGDVQTMDAVLRAEPSPVQSLRAEVGPQMSKALERALAKNPDDRFATAKQFREAFVDGPVATAPELGELVSRLGGESLKAFESLHGSREAAVTGSLPSAPSAPKPAPRRVGAWGIAAGAALAVILLGVFQWWSNAGLVPDSEAPIAAAGLDAGEKVAAVEPPVVAPLVEPVAVAPVPEPVGPPPTPPPAVKASPPRPLLARPGPEALRVGYLSADAQPWATVLLDGRPLDRTPLSRYPVPVGNHTLLFRAADGHEQSRPLSVEEGKVVTVRVEF